jgi:hypothetical protein
MMVAVAVSCAWVAQAQVQSGTLVESGRKQIGTASFTINGSVSGTVIIELAVNRLGEVTGAKVIPDGTTITSTPSVMKAQNASKKLKFTPGTHFAEFEHVRVKYTYKKI